MEELYVSTGPAPEVGEKEKPRHHRKQAEAGGGVQGSKKRPTKKDDKTTVKIAMVGILVVGVIALILAIVLGMSPSEEYSCQRAKNEGEKVSPFDVNECEAAKKKCQFDITTCSDACPLGYKNEGGCAVSCLCATDGTYESDIMFNEANIQRALDRFIAPPDNGSFDVFTGNTIKTTAPLWELGVNGRVQIPYVFDPTITTGDYRAVYKASYWFSRHSCIDLVPRKKEKAHILFIRGNGCSSFIGKTGWRQYVSLGIGCSKASIVMHEILHAAGFYHEQSRPDRDLYIKVYYENIQKEYHRQYDKARPEAVADFGYEYDVKSLMHYHSRAFQIVGKLTFVVLKTGYSIASSNEHPSETDIAEIDSLYKCKRKAANQKGRWGEWAPWGACRATCGTIGAIVQRYRRCEYKDGQFAQDCKGKNWETKVCKLKACSPKYSEWGSWSACSLTCHFEHGIHALETRRRNCINKKEGLCPNSWIFGADIYQSRYCRPEPSCKTKEDIEKEKALYKKLREIHRNPNWTGWSHWYPACPFNCDGVTKEKKRRTCAEYSAKVSKCEGNTPGSKIASQEIQRFCRCAYGMTPPTGKLSLTTVIIESDDLGSEIRRRSVEGGIMDVNSRLFCSSGKVVRGKFNEDDSVDVVCVESNHISFYPTINGETNYDSSFQQSYQFCQSENQLLLNESADFNTDTNDDLACIDRNSGQMIILSFFDNRFEVHSDWAGLQDFCVGRKSHIFAGYGDDDGRADLICLNKITNRESIIINNWNF
uniref:Metalloendopeptidase n=2 Tax=Ciona TaxID=7718 RepID=F6YKZ8_CIOIN|nr:uncharacterized protein LOC100176208 [Ciona intestinalis]AZM68747.1 tunicate astacin domain and thrombospondin type 1 repeats-containing protein 1 [Ciona robusta]|eukprot:XP_002131733.1 uncharacterized protein LOC100176208 [Ciona intestinalis]